MKKEKRERERKREIDMSNRYRRKKRRKYQKEERDKTKREVLQYCKPNNTRLCFSPNVTFKLLRNLKLCLWFDRVRQFSNPM